MADSAGARVRAPADGEPVPPVVVLFNGRECRRMHKVVVEPTGDASRVVFGSAKVGKRLVRYAHKGAPCFNACCYMFVTLFPATVVLISTDGSVLADARLIVDGVAVDAFDPGARRLTCYVDGPCEAVVAFTHEASGTPCFVRALAIDSRRPPARKRW